MKVYRYLSQTELDAFLSKDISSIGCEYDKNDGYKRINNHRYKDGVKYLHFFKDKEDCQRVRTLHEGKPVEFYIAEFDIPITVLALHLGQGRYNTRGFSEDIESVREFAIPASKIKARYLLSYTRDEAHHSALMEIEGLISMFTKCKDVFKNSTLPELQKRPPKTETPAQTEDTSFGPSQQ